MNGRHALASLALALGFTCAVALQAEDAPASVKGKDPLLDTLIEELERSTANLKGKGEEPLYYLSYRLSDGNMFEVSASYGALDSGTEDEDPTQGRVRFLDVSARVGSRKLDNTHKLRGEFSFGGRFGGGAMLPIEDDPGSIKIALWRATDEAYKSASRQLFRVKANKAIKVEEEDKADDFSEEKPLVSLGDPQTWKFEKDEWKGRLRRLSAIFKSHPLVLSSSISVQGGTGTIYFVDSDGARIRERKLYVRLMISGSVKADDGMDLDLYDSFEATSPEQLPTETQVQARVEQVISKLEALRKAPVVEPYSGPAVIVNRAAAVFFHEVFGHRIEGHRQKDEDEGQTFTKKINQKVMPEFISVYDDPTRAKFGETVLNGYYQFDEEGVPAQKASLVESGVLKDFLMGRSPIKGFPRSNGHGRAQWGMQPVARQGNLIVESTSTVPFTEVRSRLIEEVKKRGKPYGLMFQDIAGGFTNTERYMPQAFKVIPLVVYRVYPDGKPDELVRGVDLVGTPLASLEKILVTGDDYAVFNGYCGAESGFIPVSAVAPSLLIAEMEVEKKEKGHDRPPLLPPPLYPDFKWPTQEGESVQAARKELEPEKRKNAEGGREGRKAPGKEAR